ncbi:MAG: ribbon-helix-helix protein, CopG family [Acidobacteria bacterium]|nr:ribbon-helix-helix protein, CopG family [Acidobacteriota bacterium]MYC83758.1 ribbon-helix-helix protein, CopG family [Acidobacteriota bacterium]
MKSLTLRLDEALYLKISSLAERQRTTRSDIVRRALNICLDRDDRFPKGSAFEVAHDLAGILAGPSDLSSNKAHLKDFGQ